MGNHLSEPDTDAEKSSSNADKSDKEPEAGSTDNHLSEQGSDAEKPDSPKTEQIQALTDRVSNLRHRKTGKGLGTVGQF